MECVADRRRSGQRAGYLGLLMLVITIAIGAVIYLMMIRTVLPEFANPKEAKLRVWDEEWRMEPNSPERIAAEKKAKKWLELKPAITEKVTVKGAVMLDGEARGEVTIVITPKGKVSGTWKAKYKHEAIEYDVSGEFAGVTDPTNVFVDGTTARPELLYFITRGKYNQKSYDAKNQQESVQAGVVYVAGWLDATMAARGELTLTTDQSWAAVYTYRAERPEE